MHRVQVVHSSGAIVKEMTNATNHNEWGSTHVGSYWQTINEMLFDSRVEGSVCTARFV